MRFDSPRRVRSGQPNEYQWAMAPVRRPVDHPAMKRRILAAGLWCYFAWYAVALVGHAISAPVAWEAAPVVGVLVGLAVALRMNMSPRSTRRETAT